MIVGFLADKIPYSSRRGWGVYCYHLLKALLAMDLENSYRCFYNIFRKGDPKLVVSSECADLENRVWPIPGRIMDWLWDRTKLFPAEAFLGSIDLLHSPYEFLPRTRGAKTIVTVHDVSSLVYPEYQDDGFVECFTRRIRRIVDHADRIIADSENTKRELVSYACADERRIVTIPLGVDESRFHPVDAVDCVEVCRRYGVTAPYVLFVGAADADKNLARLVAAIDHLHAKHADLRLVVTGSRQWGHERLLQHAAAQRLGDSLVFTGFVSENDLAALYSGAEILAMPSIHEGFGLPVIEAMACGTPVLCSNAASLPEIAGSSGVLVDPYSVEAIEDGLDRLLVNSELRQRCTEEGLDRASRYTWRNTAGQVLEVYRELS